MPVRTMKKKWKTKAELRKNGENNEFICGRSPFDRLQSLLIDIVKSVLILHK